MAEQWWGQDAADPAHPQIQAAPAPQAGWWGKDAADPEFPAAALPRVPESRSPQRVDSGAYVDPMTGAFYPPEINGSVGDALGSGGRFLGGLAAGAAQLPVGAMQLAAHGIESLVPPQTKTPASKSIDDANAWLRSGGSPEYQAGKTIGTYAAPLGMGGPLAAARSAFARIGIGTGMGGALGAATPVENPDQDFWKEKAKQTLTGAAIGGGLPAAGAVARAIVPGPSAAVQAMRAAGVETTPGATLGGLPKLAEDWMGRIPIAGVPVQMGRQEAIHQFNRATVNEALAPIGQTLDKATPVGNKAIDEMVSKISSAYDGIVPKLTAKADPQLGTDLNQIKTGAGWLPQANREHLNSVIQDYILGRMSPAGELTGPAFQAADSAFGAIASAGRRSGDPYIRESGNAAAQIQGVLRDWLERSNPAEAEALSAAREAWARALRVQVAASRIGGEPGVFSPEQLQGAVRQLDPSKWKGSFARGQALMQDFANNASSALTLPRQPGGHAQDIGAGILGSRIVEHLAEHPFNPVTYGGLAAYPLLRAIYSNLGRGVVNQGLTLAPGAGALPFSFAPGAAQYGVLQGERLR